MVLMEAVGSSYKESFEGLGEELGFIARSFLSSVNALYSSPSSDRDRFLSLALVDLEVLLSDLSSYLRVGDAIEVLGEPGKIGFDRLLKEAGLEVLSRALESSIKALMGVGRLDYEAVEKVARASGWKASPHSLHEDVAASATILSTVAAFHKSASSSEGINGCGN
ncbi:MAG: hypothetical protein F7B17_06410 [Desulfurococcales archaeon]|nr:hypothetical protein [Desulfurococcales archaeon]